MFNVWRSASTTTLSRAAEQTPVRSDVQTFPLPNLTYSNIQIIARVIPDIATCCQETPVTTLRIFTSKIKLFRVFFKKWNPAPCPRKFCQVLVLRKIPTEMKRCEANTDPNEVKWYRYCVFAARDESYFISRRNLWNQENKNQEVVSPSLCISILLKSLNFYHDSN